MHPTLVARVVLPAYERVSGRRFWSEYRRLTALQWEPPEALAARSLRRLQALVAHAVEHVPFYRERFRRAGVRAADLRSLDDLAHVPVTTKAELRDRHPDGTVADDLPATRRWRTWTSGSTGLPFEFFTDAASADELLASHLLFLDWAGVALWHPRIDVVTAPRSMPSVLPAPSRGMALARRLLLGERVVGLSGLDALPAALVAAARAAGRGYYVRGYASYLVRLAARLLEAGTRLPVPPRVVLNCGERLSTADADRIARAFGCRVANQYSAWEVLHMAQSCPADSGLLHVNTERVIVRVVGDHGRAVRAGERGRVLITALGNHVMPLINYELGDSAVPGGPCSCGRGFPTLDSIEGRLGEALQTPAGRVVSPGTLNAVFRVAAPHVLEYQVVRTAPDAATLLVVPAASFTGEVAATLRADLERYAGPGLAVRVETVARIAPEASGKRLVIKSAPGAPPAAPGPPGGAAA